jgi:hypothetical protein
MHLYKRRKVAAVEGELLALVVHDVCRDSVKESVMTLAYDMELLVMVLTQNRG